MLERVGEAWRAKAIGKAPLPGELTRWWRVISANFNRELSRIIVSRSCCAALINLMAAADEACYGVGIGPINTTGSGNKNAFLEEAEGLLLETITIGSTLCREIHPSRARVLPKMHTPQSGLTIRSLSHYLAYCPAGDVVPNWLSSGVDTQHHSLNLLVVPWPRQLQPIQFQESKKVNLTDVVGEGGYGLFTFDARRGPQAGYLNRLVDRATKQVGPVDGIVFPELSMSSMECKKLARSVVTQKRFLVAGVGTKSLSADQCGENQVAMYVQLPDSDLVVKFSQNKHHRWKLTKSQVMQYGIGANLHPEANWWEHISVKNRSLAFVTLRPWLTVSLLICEDLARPDPVADLVRAVGPNLVVCLLMDGPQLTRRWPGRYAGSLADDPGSSVLTVTSLGMSELSTPATGERRSSVVALWRDAMGRSKEIDLPTNADALLLNLSVEYHEEWTADGRGDGGSSGYPILAGVHPIILDDK